VALDDLARAVEGSVLAPGAPEYEDARKVWNAAVDRRPAAIVRCAGPADVRRALAFAGAEGLPVTVRGGGHSIGGDCVGAGALVIDLGRLRQVDVDAGARLATVGAGARWGDLIAACAPFGLATPGGFNPLVGISGLTLGGGYGALSRVHGLSCDNLESVDVVAADGRELVADAATQPELLWAMRGAGANFGVATALRLRLHPVGPMFFGAVAHPLERGADLLRFHRDFAAGLPDAVTAYVGFKNAPGQPGHAFVAAFHVGEPADGERLLRPLRAFGPPPYDQFAAGSYAKIHDDNAGAFPEGYHNAWRARFLRDLDDGAIAALADHALRGRGHDFYFVLEQLGGAIGRVAPDATAFPHRRSPYGVAIAAKWRPGEDPRRLLELAGSLHAALRPASSGVYVNYLGADCTAADVEAAYGDNLPRLRELKRRHDPTNVFRGNVNIRPAALS
jgi:FAD/FMN-containing dehydrogenase